MESKDFTFVNYEPDLVRWELLTPVGELTPDQRFDQALQTVEKTISAFEGLLVPTCVKYRLQELYGDPEDPYETATLNAESGFTGAEIRAEIENHAEAFESPQFVWVMITASVRLTLAQGVECISNAAESGCVRNADPEAELPLEVGITQHQVHLPALTTKVTVYGHTDHWIDQDEVVTGGGSQLARINQQRLSAALYRLYDSVSPLVTAIDVGETLDGYSYDQSSLPTGLQLTGRHYIEWVLANFEVETDTGSGIVCRYSGDQIHPLIEGPEYNVKLYLDYAIPDKTAKECEKAQVILPNTEYEFEYSPAGRWVTN